MLPRVALEVCERVERRRREPGEERQRADGEAGQSRRDDSKERGSFINCRSTMLIRVEKTRGCLVVNAGVALRR